MKQPNPLLFINTYKDVKEVSQQHIFDSRKKVVSNNIDLKILREGKKFANLYNKGKNILCNINFADTSIVGTITNCSETILFVDVESEVKEIPLADIHKISYLKI